VIVQEAPRLFALECEEGELAIATPGPSKKREADECFRELWKLAREALAEADAIVFVGYRFPETDADAREQLLTAIGKNGAPGSKRRPHNLKCHIVLGNKSPQDVDRLEALLRFVAGRRGRCRQPPSTPTRRSGRGTVRHSRDAGLPAEGR
jgi:hypothetical protein